MTDDNEFHRSIISLPHQCLQAFSEATKLNINPADFSKVRSIIVCGMGGSALGPEMVKDVFGQKMAVPFLVNRKYSLPYRAGERDLVILSSYSGNTEEVLNCAREALAERAQILSLTTGGKLGELSRQEGIPCFQFDPRHNPSGQPRLGLGYSIFGLLGLLQQIQVVEYTTEHLEETNRFLKEKSEEIRVEAASLAERLKGKVPVLVGAQHLCGSARAVNNCLNENAKNFSTFFYLPELNHHLLEGLSFPHKARKIVSFLLLQSSLYSFRNQLRVDLTLDFIEEENYSADVFVLQSKDKQAQVLETILFGWWFAYQFSKANQVSDPLSVPRVEEFKERME